MPGTSAPPVSRAEISAVESRIRPYIRRTPALGLAGVDVGLDPFPLTLKLELLQHAGSFKARGAFANLLLRTIPPAGVVAASGGNHGAAVAYAARRLGVPARIYVPSCASPSKRELIQGFGATLVVAGQWYADALEASESWAGESGALRVHAFDQYETMLGQGTVGLELEEQAPELDTILVPVGGGGLIGGIAAWYAGRVKLVGVEPELAPTLTRAFAAGGPVDAPAGGIAADSLAPRRIGERVFPIVRAHVAQVLLVGEEEIVAGQEMLWRALRIVAEPGGAAAFGALLSRKYRPRSDERVGVVVSGGNTIGVSFTR
jgi:threonine dehydratase